MRINARKFLKKYWMVIAMIVALIVPSALYIWTFHDSHISSDPADWGNFGSFFGGIYSILVTILVVYLARDLSKKDERARKRQEALEQIYSQLDKINPDHIDVRSVNKIFKLVDSYRLFLPDTISNKIIDLANYYIEVKGNSRDRDTKYENDIINMIIDKYND